MNVVVENKRGMLHLNQLEVHESRDGVDGGIDVIGLFRTIDKDKLG